VPDNEWTNMTNNNPAVHWYYWLDDKQGIRLVKLLTQQLAKFTHGICSSTE